MLHGEEGAVRPRMSSRSRRASHDESVVCISKPLPAPARIRRSSKVEQGSLDVNRPTRNGKQRLLAGQKARRGTKSSAFESSPEEYWQGGDALFDHPEYRRRRLELRENPEVIAALDEWWQATDADGNGVIDRDEYICLGKALYRVMIGDGNEEAAQRSAENDWVADSKGLLVMKGTHFKRAIFELADLCESLPSLAMHLGSYSRLVLHVLHLLTPAPSLFPQGPIPLIHMSMSTSCAICSKR